MASMEARQAELDRLANGYKSSKFPTCPEVGPRELWDRMQRGEADFVVVDARRPEEQEVSRAIQNGAHDSNHLDMWVAARHGPYGIDAYVMHLAQQLAA